MNEITHQPNGTEKRATTKRKRRPPTPPKKRDLRTAMPETLVTIKEIVAPDGPAPWRRSRFIEAVARGEAPAPVMRGRRCTRWLWADVQRWLDQIAGREA